MENYIKVIGKQSFYSSKKQTDYFIIFYWFEKKDVQGVACDRKFVSKEVFDKVELNKKYRFVYGAYENGRAFVSNIEEVN